MSDGGCMFDSASITNSIDDLTETTETLARAMEELIGEVAELAALVETLKMNIESVHQDVAKQGVVLNSLNNLTGQRRAKSGRRVQKDKG